MEDILRRAVWILRNWLRFLLCFLVLFLVADPYLKLLPLLYAPPLSIYSIVRRGCGGADVKRGA